MTAQATPGPDSGGDGGTRFDAIVLGAGISGLVCASVLLDQGSRRVLVVDEYPRVGGNHLDFHLGDYTFDVGSLVFQDDSPLLRHFPEITDRYLPIDPTWGRLNPQGVVTEYPFSVRDDFLAAGPRECALLLLSAAAARVRHRRPRNAQEFARRWIGPRLLDRSGLGTYMARFCGVAPEHVELEFAEQRMMWIAEHASVGNLSRRVLRALRDRRPGRRPAPAQPVVQTNRQLVRPREGFTHLYAPARDRLESRGTTFQLGMRADRLHREDGAFRLDVAGQTFVAPRVISTIPVDQALDLIGAPGDQPLPSVTLVTLFLSFAGRRGFDDPILYNFSHDGAWKRLTVHSDFYGPVGGREYLAVEVLGDMVGASVDRAAADFRAHTAANGLFTGDLRLEGGHVLEHAYPIYTAGSGARSRRLIATLRDFGLESFGRQGGFQYQPTARVSTVEAERTLGVSS